MDTGCYHCKYDGRGFPCRGGDGTLDYEKIADAYIGKVIDYSRNQKPDDWASECVDELENSDASALFFILVALDRLHSANAQNIGFLSAGPLENVLARFGKWAVGPVETIARKSPKFRLLLSGVWGQNRIEPAVWAKVRQALGKGPFMDGDPRTPGAGSGVPVTKEEFWKILDTSVIDDLGGREAAAAITGIVPG